MLENMLKVNNRNTRTRCEICSKLTIKTPERRHWCRSGVFILNFKHNSHFLLLFLLLTSSRLIAGRVIKSKWLLQFEKFVSEVIRYVMNFTKFRGKNLWGSLFSKFADGRPAEALAQMFAFEFYEIFKFTYFVEHLRMAASGISFLNWVHWS